MLEVWWLELVLKHRYSALVGIVGGFVDLIAGVAVVQSTVMVDDESMMATANAQWVGYSLMLLGVIVLSTGFYLLTPRMMNRSVIGPVMLLYGVIMLVLGVAMFAGMLSMMQNSALSGAAMLMTGTAMLYSGYSMWKK